MGFVISRSKYNNKKCTAGAHKFDSLAERDYYLHLLKQKACGKIKHIELQPRVYLTEARILMKPDFLVTYPDGSTCYLEVKGFETAVYKLKLRLWKFYGPGKLDVIKLKRKEWVVVDSCTTLGVLPQGT